ncbi:MAG: hypothetical protein Q7U01_05305 [Pseudomonas sp.]|nr:hypothetical protein [Pseudomonas sp.]
MFQARLLQSIPKLELALAGTTGDALMDISLHRLKGAGLLLALLTLPVEMPQAADGEIVISRPVQPRVATRAPLARDTNPRSVYASPTHYADLSQLGNSSQGELSDNDFAGVSSGRTLATQLPSAQTTFSNNNAANLIDRAAGTATHRTSGSSGLSGLSGQINRSLQQGLQPLKMLGGQ